MLKLTPEFFWVLLHQVQSACLLSPWKLFHRTFMCMWWPWSGDVSGRIFLNRTWFCFRFFKRSLLCWFYSNVCVASVLRQFFWIWISRLLDGQVFLQMDLSSKQTKLPKAFVRQPVRKISPNAFHALRTFTLTWHFFFGPRHSGLSVPAPKRRKSSVLWGCFFFFFEGVF